MCTLCLQKIWAVRHESDVKHLDRIGPVVMVSAAKTGLNGGKQEGVPPTQAPQLQEDHLMVQATVRGFLRARGAARGRELLPKNYFEAKSLGKPPG